jgi:hypothetical protein
MWLVVNFEAHVFHRAVIEFERHVCTPQLHQRIHVGHSNYVLCGVVWDDGLPFFTR